MAAPTIAEVMQAIETALDTISGLRVNDVQADQINPPEAVVGVPPVPDYHQTMGRGFIRLEPTVTVFVSAGAGDRNGQLALAAYANPTGSSSVVAAIEADKTLGGVVDDCIVLSFHPLGLVTVGTVQYYAGEFALRVAAQGD